MSVRQSSRVLVVMLLLFLTWATEAAAVPWPPSSPEAQGVDSRILVDFLERVQAEELDLHSVLVIRHGHLIFECYVHPYEPAMLHNVKSVSKSVLSGLVGILLAEGVIDSLGQPAAALLPQHIDIGEDQRKAEITLEHLLTMTAGLELDENGPITQEVFSSDDWIKAAWARDRVAAPGARFNYSTALSHTMSGILTKLTGKSASELADSLLFGPLGCDAHQWAAGPQGYSFGGAELFLTPRDMARFGMLFLHDGRWEGEQIVPADWVVRSTQNQIPHLPGVEPYGYWWWLDDVGNPSARGWGGQAVAVVRSEDLVVVMTGGNHTLPDVLMETAARYPLSDEPLKPRPKTMQRLSVLVQELSDPEPLEVQQLPQTAHEISGVAYQCEENPLRISQVGLRFFSEGGAEIEIHGAQGSATYAVGLDGRYRLTDKGTEGSMPDGNREAIRGRWISGRTLVLDIMEMGNPIAARAHLTFQGDGLSLRIMIRPLGVTHEIAGHRIE